jgi:NADH:ubiquinone oxidoreductase subunit F (NADH-binding)
LSAEAANAYRRLAEAASERLVARAGKTRIVVQVGHCSQAVGAADVASAFESALPDSAYLVASGCDGACFAAPQVFVTSAHGVVVRHCRIVPDDVASILDGVASGDQAPINPEIGNEVAQFFAPQHRTTTGRLGEADAANIDECVSGGGFEGLANALSASPEDVIQTVSDSGLRGRGGAYFPAAIKWRGAKSNPGRPKYLVVNCEEGEPGIFKDRHLMEGLPFQLLEGSLIAAYAAGLNRVYLYINAEANLSALRVQNAIEQARSLGLVGEDVLGSGFSVDVEVRRGAGGYVCGDETTMLNTMEGKRREPRTKDPLPVVAGLWARPTVINNAETIASTPFIMTAGSEAYNAVGSGDARGTKLISLSGSVRRPGMAEVPMGTTIRELVDDVGGGPEAGRTITTLAVGGPSSGVMTADMIDTPIMPGSLHDSGVMLGAGGVVPLDERLDVLDVVRDLAAYNADESCGKCTPCREGTPLQVAALDRVISGSGSSKDVEELRHLANVINAASLCNLGQLAGNPVLSALHFFGDTFESRVESRGG